MAKLFKFNVAGLGFATSDVFVTDSYTNSITFISFIAYTALANAISTEINKNNSIYMSGIGYFNCHNNDYEIEKKKQANSDFVHVIAYKRDIVKEDKSQDDDIESYIYYHDIDEMHSRLYDKIYKNTAVPILREWVPYIASQLQSTQKLREVLVNYDKSDNAPQPFRCQILRAKKSNLINIISNGLRNNSIRINDKTTSEVMTNVIGLDHYLNQFGTILANKVQESFIPKFIPGESSYDPKVDIFDDACFDAGIEIFEAQKAVIQAGVNNLNKNNLDFIIGEMGSGKTLIGCGITYAHAKKNGITSVVLCPAHLTNKWKREIERLVPNGKGYIIKHISDLQKLDDKIRNPRRVENMYLIVSKEIAKFGYEKRPSVLWSNIHNTFVCPHCGQTLRRKTFEGTGRHRRPVFVNFSKTDMSSESPHNLVCTNAISYWDEEMQIHKERPCGEKLWTVLNREDVVDSGWTKLGSEGWILVKHVEDMFDDYSNRENLSRPDSRYLIKLSEKMQELEADKLTTIKAPRKYPIAKYLKKFYSGVIDYLLADELHLYKGDTEQGQAFGDLTVASNNVICLTGTLLNGYADGLFYILYRTMPGVMKKDKFKYSDEKEFMRRYGVVRKSNRFAGTDNSRIGSGSEKKLPGVSPLVFTRYLLENAAFLSLSDMAEGLVSYEEIPLAVEMDPELHDAYANLEIDLRAAAGFRGSGGMKIMGSLLQSLSVFPDMPYDQPPICHPDTGAVLTVPPELSRGLRNKEERLLELVQEKKEMGEKVLVYYHWTNRTDLAERLGNMFTDNDIQYAVLESKVGPEKREAWIATQVENGVDVVICNPTLVETGLDLLDFTTIVFYQVGYNIFTMRQASRRSWRLSQTHPIQVYFLYYQETIQEQALSLMATKLQASMAIEGRFSEEGLRAMSNNEDLLTQIANSVVNGIRQTVNAEVFKTISQIEGGIPRVRRERRSKLTSESNKLRISYFSVIKDNGVKTSSHLFIRNLFEDINPDSLECSYA